MTIALEPKVLSSSRAEILLLYFSDVISVLVIEQDLESGDLVPPPLNNAIHSQPLQKMNIPVSKISILVK